MFYIDIILFKKKNENKWTKEEKKILPEFFSYKHVGVIKTLDSVFTFSSLCKRQTDEGWISQMIYFNLRIDKRLIQITHL